MKSISDEIPSGATRFFGLQSQVMHSLSLGLSVLFTFAAFCPVSFGTDPQPPQHRSAAAQTNEPKRILILLQEDVSWPVFRLIDENLRITLRNGLPAGIQIFGEHLDRSHFPDPVIQAEHMAWLQKKYKQTNFDLVIAVGDVPTDLFPSVPLLFVSADPSRKAPSAASPAASTANVWVGLEAQETVEVAERLQPEAKRIVIIGEGPISEDSAMGRLRRVLPTIAGNLQPTFVTNLVVPEVCQLVSKLGTDSIVLFTTRFHDEHGHPLISAEVVQKVAAASGAPVYVLFDTHVGTGAVGGYVASFAEIGKTAGQQGLRILAGEHPQDVVTQNVYLFDWRQLRRWNISESALPVGSVVLYREPTAWDLYKNYVIGGTALVISLTALIFYLLWERAKKQKVERALVKSEGILRESEERFRLIANSAPVLIWISGTDKLCTFFNEAWLDFTGRTMEQEAGEGWTSGLHPEDLENYLENYSTAFNAHTDFEMEYRLRRSDGVFRWLVDIGVPRYGSDGVFLGYVGSCIDITDRKLTEASLKELSGRLITAQEQERTRIARELHDDFSQRMAIQGIGLEQLWKQLPASEVEEREKVQELLKRTQEISFDLHSLSHQLHSSRLDHVGLASALQGLCEEISEKYRIEVEFIEHGTPFKVPKDVALCLFRVAQEALGNVVKHSQATEAQAELSITRNEITLRIADSGVGFDLALRESAVGIGLVGMRERLRLVGGALSVRSTLARGTEILAEVPLSVVANQPESRAHASGG
jgi:PAS domain S-box-containing protein